MAAFLRSALDTFRQVGASDALEIGLLAAMIYALLRLVRGTTAMSLLRGGALLYLALWLVAELLDLEVLRWLLRNSLAGLVTAAVIIFQPEIRRALEWVGRANVARLRTRPATLALIDAIARGSRALAERRHGALIVIERETGLEDYITTGHRVDAAVSEDLLSNIFFRNAPLHDGAVIIRGDRIVAAGCMLPLTDAQLDGHFGTRHRAGIGITERTDAVSVIVSEETGEISLASNGRLIAKLDDAHLRSLLASLLRQEGGPTDRGPRGDDPRRAPAVRWVERGVEQEVVG